MVCILVPARIYPHTRQKLWLILFEKELPLPVVWAPYPTASVLVWREKLHTHSHHTHSYTQMMEERQVKITDMLASNAKMWYFILTRRNPWYLQLVAYRQTEWGPQRPYIHGCSCQRPQRILSFLGFSGEGMSWKLTARQRLGPLKSHLERLKSDLSHNITFWSRPSGDINQFLINRQHG